MSESSVFRSVRRPERRRRTLLARMVRWLLIVLVVGLVVVVGLLVRKAATALAPAELQTLVLNETDPDAPVDQVEGTSVTLLVGVDRRLPPPEPIAGATADPRGPAMTSMISLVQTTPRRTGTAIVTIPPQLQVQPPGVLGPTPIGQVQALGGPDALLATVQELVQMPIDHYLEVDLAGVVGLVDAVGGVEVCLDDVALGPEPGPSSSPSSPSTTPSASVSTTPSASVPPEATASAPPPAPPSTPASPGAVPATTNPTSTVDATPAATATTGPTGTGPTEPGGVAAGCQVFDGAAAAGFLSSRSDAGQELDVQRRRLAEQHYLLARVLERTRRAEVLVNPLRVNRILDSLQAAVVSDVDPGLRGMVELAGDIADFDRDQLIVRVVPSYRTSAGGDTLLYLDQANTLFDALRTGRDLSTVESFTSDELGPEDITVLVVNGIGVPGIAGDASTYLTQRDFIVACAVNPSDLDPRATFDDTQEDIVVQYLAEDQVLADLLVEAFGNLALDLRPAQALPPLPSTQACGPAVDDVDIVVTLGTAWTS